MRFLPASIRACALIALVLQCAAMSFAVEAAPPPEDELWLPAPTWAAPIHQVPPSPPAAASIRPEPIPLPPAAVAVLVPALLTAIMARLSLKKRLRRAGARHRKRL